MIRGYPDQTTVFPGAHVTLRVSTDAPQFRVELYRQGASLDLQLTSDWLLGQMTPDHTSDQDWSVDGMVGGRFVPAWAAYPIDLPASLPPGVYIAMFVEGDGNGNERGNTPPLDRSTADAREAKALFVVRNPAAGINAPILFKLALLTYQAYNAEGGWSLYTTPGPPVTLHRPGGGTGGTPSDSSVFDPNDNATPRQVFGHWEAPFVAWLESNGWSVDYCTDLDVDGDVNGELLGAYQLLLSVGHDEYWTAPMRDNVERYIANGGNVAFFSGNTCWWQITFDDPVTIRRPANWWRPDGPDRPENTLTGVSYRNGGGWWGGSRDQVGYTVQNLDHWVFTGLQLQDLQVIGNTRRPPAVGYECDGAPISFDPDGHGVPIPDSPLLRTYTPSSFTVLGVGRLTQLGDGTTGWLLEAREADVDQAAGGIHAGTMGVYENNGTVFTAASTDWAPAVASGQEPEVEQITRNVLSRLSALRLST